MILMLFFTGEWTFPQTLYDIPAREIAMGGVSGITGSPGAVWYNPAALGNLEHSSLSITGELRSYGEMNGGIFYFYHEDLSSSGIFLVVNQMQGIELWSEENESLGTASSKSFLVAFPIAYTFSKNLTMGILCKYISENLIETSLTALSGDAGLLLSFPPFHAGISVRNVYGVIHNIKWTSPLREIRVAFARESENLTGEMDLYWRGNSPGVSLGVEYMAEWVYLRAGFSWLDTWRICTGLGVREENFSLDLAFTVNDLSYRTSFSFTWFMSH